jgi:hypothetical protein
MDPQTRADMVTLKEHLETRLDALDKSIAVATQALEKRLSGMNEFRDTLRDQAARFVTRDEVTAQIARMSDLASAERAAMRDQIKLLQTFVDKSEGKASLISVYIGYVIGIAGIVIALLK